MTETIKDKNFISLDLELNNDPEGSTPTPKIIQVGISIGNMNQDSEQFLIKKWYLNPREPIFPFIEELTGITDNDIKNYAVPHYQCALELSELIHEYKPFINPIVWGGGDSFELLSEFRERDIHFPHFGRRWIDVKTIFTYLNWSKGKTSAKSSLNSGLAAFDMKFHGTPHRADDDAYNTLILFFKMLERQLTIEEFVAEVRS